MGDREIVSGSSFRECFKPLWAGTASERSYLALVLLAQSSLGPSPAQVFMQLHVNLGVNPAENGVGSLFQTVPWAGLPRCCTNSSCGEGVVMNWNWASYGRFCFSVFYFSVFLFFCFFFFSYFYVFPNSSKQSVSLMTVLVFLCHLWAGSDFFPLLLLSASFFMFPNVCIAAALNTWEPSQNNSSTSAPLTSLELSFHCWYKSHNLYRLCTHRKERELNSFTFT